MTCQHMTWNPAGSCDGTRLRIMRSIFGACLLFVGISLVVRWKSSSDRLLAWSGGNVDFSLDDARQEHQLQLRDTVHLASVACHRNHSANYLAVLLKSVLYHFDATDHDLHIHIFTDNVTQPRLHEREPLLFPLMDVLPYVTLTQYDVHNINISDEHLNLFRPCAGARLAFPHIAPFEDVEKLIYLDSDTLMLTHINELWSVFNSFESHQHSAMALENYRAHEQSYYLHPRMGYRSCPDGDENCMKIYGKLGINSGVYLMHLGRMRTMNLYASLMTIVRGPATKEPGRFHLGDQDLLNTYFHDHPDEMFELPCEWNFRTDSACPFKPALLHGNRGTFHQLDKRLWSTHWQAIDVLPHTALIDANVLRQRRGEITSQLPVGVVPAVVLDDRFDNLTEIAPIWEWE